MLVAAGTIEVIKDVDLIITEVTPSASTIATGQSFTVTTTIKNQGTTDAAAGTGAGIYLSTDATVTTSDQGLASAYAATADMTAGGELTTVNTLTIPVTQAAGTYYVGVIADFQNAEAETDETNNVLVAAGTIDVVKDVDLIVTQAEPSVSSISTGQSFTVNFTVRNQGTSNGSANTLAGIYLSPDATVTAADQMLGDPAMGYLSAGGESTKNTIVTMPASTTPGTYYIGVIADFQNAEAETDETNNGLVAAGTLEVTSP